jgi:hypothetical protein
MQRRQSERPIQITVVQARQRGPIMGVVGLAVVLVAAAGGAFWALHAPPPPPVATAASAIAPPTATASIAGVPILDRSRVDPTDMLPAIKRRLADWSSDPQLVEITVSHSQKGVVDLREAGAEVVYRYTSGPQALKAGPGNEKRPGRRVVLRENAPAPDASPLRKEDDVVPEPNCVWSAAWRAAVKSGIPDNLPVEGRYGPLGRAREPIWQVSVPGQPSFARDIDGMTCAIKAH